MVGKSRTLYLLFTLGAASLAAGCVASSSDEFTFYLTWSLEDASRVPVTCGEAGGETVEIDVTNLGSEARYVDTFSCRAKAGASRRLPRGDYRVTLVLRDADQRPLSQTTLPGVLAIGRGVTDLGHVYFGVHIGSDQYFQLSWSIEKQGNGAHLTCPQADATKVELLTRQGSATPVAYHFRCDDMVGSTTKVAPGTYGVTVSLISSGEVVLSTASMRGVAVAPGQPTFIPVVFEVQ